MIIDVLKVNEDDNEETQEAKAKEQSWAESLLTMMWASE
jgi:hypothetical protein